VDVKPGCLMGWNRWKEMDDTTFVQIIGYPVVCYLEMMEKGNFGRPREERLDCYLMESSSLSYKYCVQSEVGQKLSVNCQLPLVTKCDVM
jgi:hypothetical protein